MIFHCRSRFCIGAHGMQRRVLKTSIAHSIPLVHASIGKQKCGNNWVGRMSTYRVFFNCVAFHTLPSNIKKVAKKPTGSLNKLVCVPGLSRVLREPSNEDSSGEKKFKIALVSWNVERLQAEHSFLMFSLPIWARWGLKCVTALSVYRWIAILFIVVGRIHEQRYAIQETKEGSNHLSRYQRFREFCG